MKFQQNITEYVVELTYLINTKNNSSKCLALDKIALQMKNKSESETKISQNEKKGKQNTNMSTKLVQKLVIHVTNKRHLKFYIYGYLCCE